MKTRAKWTKKKKATNPTGKGGAKKGAPSRNPTGKGGAKKGEVRNKTGKGLIQPGEIRNPTGKGGIQPGEIRNPKGNGAIGSVIRRSLMKFKDQEVNSQLRESEIVQNIVLDAGLEPTYDNLIAATLIYLGVYDQNLSAIKEYYNRTEGKSVKKIDKTVRKMVVFMKADAATDLTNDDMI